MRKDLWKIILIADAILVVIGIVSCAFGVQRIHVTKITGPQVIELESLTLEPGEQHNETLWVELNEPPLYRLGDILEGTSPAIVFDYHVTGTVEVLYENPEGHVLGFLMTDVTGGSDTVIERPWVRGSYRLVLSAHEEAGTWAPLPVTQATIHSLVITNEYFALRENPQMITIGGSLAFLGLVTSGAGFGLMRRGSKAE